MTWHVAGSLQQLLDQINALFPGRSKSSDGSIGDAAHASRNSDHNPWYANTVTARDFTHDPDNGMPGQWLADALVRSGDPRIKYVIWNHRIWNSRGWRPYNGPNAHTHHVHVSVVADSRCESRQAWNLGTPPGGARPAERPSPGPAAPAGGALLPELRAGSVGPAVTALQTWIKRYAPEYAGRVLIDGQYGPQMTRVMREFQGRMGIARDGVVGRDTNRALWAAGYRGLL